MKRIFDRHVLLFLGASLTETDWGIQQVLANSQDGTGRFLGLFVTRGLFKDRHASLSTKELYPMTFSRLIQNLL